ncbi:hypothetical protein YC2023_066129 [Brassica napus]
MSVAVHQYPYQHVGPWTQHPDPSRGLFGTHRTSVAVHQYTYQHVVHIGRLWVSASTHWTSVAVRVCPCVSVSTHKTSKAVHHTHDVRGCPPAPTGRPWLSVSTHRTSLAVRLCPWASASTHRTSLAVRGCSSAHKGRPCVSVSTHRTSVCVSVCRCVSVSTHKTSVAVHQYTYQHAGPWTQHAGPSRGLFGTHRTSVAVHQYTYQHAGPSTQHTGHGLSTLALLVDCLGDFGPRGLSVQYTQDVCGCPLAHTGCPWVSVSTHRTSLAVRVCLCVSISTHRTFVAVHQYTYQQVGPWTQHADPSHGLFGMSLAVRVCPSTHTGRPWLSISTHISTLVLGLSTLTLLVDCSGDFGPRELSVQYTQDVCGCPLALTERPCMSVSVHVCPSVSVRTHRTSMAVQQYTYQHVVHIGRLWVSASTHWTSVAVLVCPCAHTRRPRLSISTHISTLFLGLSTLCLPVDCLGDFGPRGLSVQYTRRPWVSFSTHRTSVAVRLHTQDVFGCPFVSVGVCQHTQNILGCPWLFVSTHRTSVCVRQHTQDVRVCQCVYLCVSQHTQDVRGCPSVHISARWSLDTACWPIPWSVWVILAHVGCLFSTHRTFVGVHQHTQDVLGCPCVSVGVRQHSEDVLACPWLFGSTHRTSVCLRQHTQDVRVCPSAHTGRPCVSVFVGVCPSAHTRRPWLSISTHISTLVLGLSMVALPVDCLGDFGPRGQSVQYTQAVCGCPPEHTGRPWLSVCVRMFPCVSVSTHRTSVAVHQYTYQHAGPSTQHAGHGLSTLALLVDCLGDFGTRGLSVQYTQDVCGCPLAHTGCPWVSVSTHRTSMAVRVCLCVSISTHRTFVAVHQYTYHQVGPWTQHADPSHGLFGTSLAVRVCPSTHTGRPWLSISTHISTLVLRLSTLTLLVDCSGDFGPRELSVQYTQDVCGCPLAHTERPCMSVSVHVCPSVSVSTQRTSVAVQQYTYQHVVQYTQDVRGYPSAHTGRPWLSVCVRGCPPALRGRPWLSVAVRQHTQDIRVCPSAHTGRPCVSVSTHRTSVCVSVCRCVSVSTHRTSVAVHQYTSAR